MKNFMMVLLILVGTQAQAEVKMATIDPGPFIATLYVPVAVSKLSPSASIIKLYTGMSSYVDEAL
ncbi:MAG TPA: hypothetical protein VN132_06920, partial [Bdellovibrio sp.]|nr:hypothetical protein [Bdellovibrio sp.]